MNFLNFDERTFIGLGILLYCGAFAYGLTTLIRKRKHRKLFMLALVAGGFVLQTLGLYMRGMDLGRCPLGNPFEKVQFIVWSAILLYHTMNCTFSRHSGAAPAQMRSHPFPLPGRAGLLSRDPSGPRHLLPAPVLSNG